MSDQIRDGKENSVGKTAPTTTAHHETYADFRRGWRSKLRNVLRLTRISRSAQIGLPIVVLVIAAALFAPYIRPHDPFKQDLRSRIEPPFWHAEGSISHPLGTDQFGRDLLSRIISFCPSLVMCG